MDIRHLPEMHSHLPKSLNRRRFLQSTAAGYLGLALPPIAWAGDALGAADESFDALSRDLLRDWCDGMLAVQIHAPDDPTRHGALDCPGCNFIHGRCMDAVYPFLHMAKVTGEEKYLTAGINVFEWSKNVTLPNGAWSNDLNPNSWQGTTLFGAIALAEALHHHGDLLDDETRARWTERLGRAADFIYQTITWMEHANINYGCVSIFGMHLLGKVLDRPQYLERSRKLAAELDNYISEPSGLIFGEGKPAQRVSPRGARPVDLAYNVEESIPAIAMTAVATGDEKLTATAVRLLESHLDFMLPDGAWDNSFGTRQAKWTYFGSRTSDGCQPGYALMVDHHSAFAAAVIENTRLMRRCTHDGLLAGGPHLVSAGMKPCVHQTFVAAKALAMVRDQDGLVQKIQRSAPLPRAVADGVRHYPEITTWLAARGPWRATITATDWIYRPGIRQPTGGCISLLWHPQAGPIFAGSMPRYVRVEQKNMQVHPHPGNHPLTPRVELRDDETWHTQLFDLAAEVTHTDADGRIAIEVATRLLDEDGNPPRDGRAECALTYHFDAESAIITARAPGVGSESARPRLVLPIISPTGETVTRVSGNRIEIRKPGGTLIIEANAPLEIEDPGRPRIFNLVPGFEAVPVFAEIPAHGKLSCSIRVMQR
jgi:hypothetical protein